MALTIFDSRRASLPVRGVLFDMDGVILDTEKLYARFWREAANDCGFPMTHAQALGMRSLNRAAGQKKLESYFGPGVDIHVIRARRIELMDAYIRLHGADGKPGAKDVLEALQNRGIPCAITTSSPRQRALEHLGSVGLLPYFTAICTGYDVPHGKPEPDIYLHGAATLGLSPESCLAVEDSPAGLLSASRAGCRAVMVPDLDQPDDSTLPLLCALADTLTDILGLI